MDTRCPHGCYQPPNSSQYSAVSNCLTLNETPPSRLVDPTTFCEPSKRTGSSFVPCSVSRCIPTVLAVFETAVSRPGKWPRHRTEIVATPVPVSSCHSREDTCPCVPTEWILSTCHNRDAPACQGSKVLRVPALSSAFIDFPNNHVPKTFITSVFTYLIKILKTKHNTKLNANLLKTSLSNNDYFFKQDFLTI